MTRLVNKINGFTLIEILVVIGILAAIGLMVVDIMSKSFKSNDKTKLISNLKQNGQSALNIIDRTIRQSDSVLCTAASTGEIILLKPKNKPIDGSYIRFRFVVKDALKNGKITQDFPNIADPSITAQVQALCDPAQVSSNLNKEQDLTDTDLKNGVAIFSGSFENSSASGYKDIVAVKFSLVPAINAGSGFENKICVNKQTNNDCTVDFQTTIQLRQ